MIQKGSKVSWKWGSGSAEGKVVETYSEEISKTIKGSTITRKGEENNRALYIKQEDGDTVLKLESEVKHIKD